MFMFVFLLLYPVVFRMLNSTYLEAYICMRL